MEAENAIFVSVYIQGDTVTVATDFDYASAKETMIKVMEKSFHVEQDDGLIYKSTGQGESEVIFNFRAFLNSEGNEYQPAPKSNDHVKLFFSCPKCKGTKGKPTQDEDGDLIVLCRKCETPVPLY